MRNSIKKSITLTLADEELMELLRMIFDEDEKETLSFLQKHFKDKSRAVLDGEGHCKASLAKFSFPYRGYSPLSNSERRG